MTDGRSETGGKAGQGITILAMDASAGSCSVAVGSGGAALAHLARAMTHGHAAVLPPMIRQVMDDAGRPFAALDAVGVTVGPGSFTGVRVGLAAARGVALAVGCPCIGVTSLEAVAAAAAFPGLLLVALDTRRGDVYAQVFDAGVALGSAFVASRGTIGAVCPAGVGAIAGDGSSQIADAFPPSVERLPVNAPDAQFVAALARHRLLAGEFRPAVPLYLRAPEVSVPRALAEAAP